MLVNASAINAVFVNLRTTFNNAFQAAPSRWASVAMKVPSTTRQEDYAWLSNFPQMRKWIGEKQVRSLAAHKYSIVNDDWEATVEVDRNDIEDDTLGIYGPQAQMAGYSAAQLPDELVWPLLNNGFAATCFDGQYFFDDDHPVGAGVKSNKGSAALSVATQALANTSYGAARTALATMQDDEGRPLNISGDTLVVPPALELTALALLGSDRLDDGKTNPFKGTAKVEVVPWLSSATAWFLLDTKRPIKPLIYQERKAPVFVQMTDPQTENVFMRRKFLFGAEARGASGYGFWQMAYGSTGTG